jgi:hypothetical protein
MAIDVERFLRDEADKAAVWSMDCYNIRVLTMSDLDHIIIKLAALARAESSPQAALVPEVGREEPVAWRYRRAGGGWLFGEHPLKDHDNDLNQEPLYTRPAATPEAVMVPRATACFCSGLIQAIKTRDKHTDESFAIAAEHLNALKAALSAPAEGR